MIKEKNKEIFNYARLTFNSDLYTLIKLNNNNKDIIINKLPKYYNKYWSSIPERYRFPIETDIEVIENYNFLDSIEYDTLEKIELLFISKIKELKGI